MKIRLITFAGTFALISCQPYFKNDYADNSPTSGKLKVYYDEGLQLHLENQAYTFEALYPDAHLELISCPENEAVQALYSDSCQAIVISRPLSVQEKKAFDSRGYSPKFSLLAYSGVALITNRETPLAKLSYEQVIELLSKPFSIKDSTGNIFPLRAVFDKNNSAVVHYLADSLLKGGRFSTFCSSLNSTPDCIAYVAKNKNSVAFINFAWLSDVDDSIYKANTPNVKFICVSKPASNRFEYPSQSSFKLATYPFIRKIYYYRKTGDFTLSKGFQSFMAGANGQMTFLKQGLMPGRQSEREIKINFDRPK